MVYIGEIISLGVAFSFTVAALSCEVAGRQWGGLVLNVWRMLLGCALSCILTWVLAGYPFPVYARVDTWMWLALSGFVGYFFGDRWYRRVSARTRRGQATGASTAA